MKRPMNRSGAAAGGDTTGFALAVIVGGLAAGAWMTWHLAPWEISAAVMNVSHWEMQFIHHLTHRFDGADAGVLKLLRQGENSASFQHALANNEMLGKLVRLTRNIGGFFLWPAEAIVVVLALCCFRRATPTRYCRKLDLDGLMREQARSFRAPGAFASRHLALSEIADGEPLPADSALNAGEWVKRFATSAAGDFDEVKARQELRRQLGPVWRGAEQAEPHARCLIAAFVLHAMRRRAEALSLLGDLAEALPAGREESGRGPRQALAFPASLARAADAVLADKQAMRQFDAAMARHAFTAPAMMSLLSEARLRAGVLAPAQFGFVKLVDRRLWYALHGLGFPGGGVGQYQPPCVRVEAIGAMDHWAAERLMGVALRTPTIDKAVEAIRAAIHGGVVA